MLLGSFLVSLLAGELVLRAIGFSFPSFLVPDPVTGARLRAGMEGWVRDEGTTYVRINSSGLRDHEHATEKPRGVYRIAVLGDSFAEALQVKVERTFWWKLARRLERCGFQPGKHIEPVNFGVSGYGTAQELLTLRHRVWEYAPDLVLLAFFPGNDVRNNSRTLEPDPFRPFYVLRNGVLALDDSFRHAPRFQEALRLAEQRAFLQPLRLYQLLRRVRAGELQLHANAPIGQAVAAGAEIPSLGERGLDENALREPTDPAWQAAWQVSERLIAAVGEEVRRRGARYVVAVVSAAGAVHPDADLRQRYAAALRSPDLLYPERRLQAFAERAGIELIALAPEMQQYAEATRTYLHGFANSQLGFGHWNEEGHEIAAEILSRRLCPGERSAVKTLLP